MEEILRLRNLVFVEDCSGNCTGPFFLHHAPVQTLKL